MANNGQPKQLKSADVLTVLDMMLVHHRYLPNTVGIHTKANWGK